MSSLFCDEKNIDSCLHLLSGELEVLGLSTVSTPQENVTECIVALVNVSWALVSSSKKQVLKISDLNEKVLHLSKTINNLEDGKRKQKSVIENDRSKTFKLEQKLSEIQVEIEKLSSANKDLKKELESLQNCLSSQILHHQHEIKRKEILINQLQKKLFHLAGEIKPSRDHEQNDEGVKLSASFSVYSDYVLSLRNNIELLLNENVNLRSTLLSIYYKIHRELENEPSQDEIFLNLPYQAFTTKLEEDIRSLLDKKSKSSRNSGEFDQQKVL